VPRPRIDLSATVAVAWIWVALGLTVVFAPQLGLRGLVWLGLHHLLCIVGVTHELRRYRQRQRPLTSAASPAPATAADPADASMDPGTTPS
jgi:hypothetical protein